MTQLSCINKTTIKSPILFFIIHNLFNLFVVSFAFPFEIIQQAAGVQVNRNANELKEIKTNNGNIKINLNNNKLDIFSKTEIFFTNDEIKLAAGEFKITVSNFNGVKVLTPVGTVNILNNGEYIVLYHPENATLTAVILDGSAFVQGQYREETLMLQIGEKGGFEGVYNKNGPTFDILLKGRKSIRGKLFGPIQITEEQKSSYNTQYSILLKQKVVKVFKPKPKPGEICSNPFGKFNDCLWRCEDSNKQEVNCKSERKDLVCIRERCLANGRWGDKTIIHGLLKSVCKTNKGEPSKSVKNNKDRKTSLVLPCEY